MAHRKAGGVARKLRDSNPQYLGIKVADGQSTRPGALIVRQRGTKFLPGDNAALAGDDSIYALVEGVVRFTDKRKTRYDGTVVRRKLVSVEPKTSA